MARTAFTRLASGLRRGAGQPSGPNSDPLSVGKGDELSREVPQ